MISKALTVRTLAKLAIGKGVCSVGGFQVFEDGTIFPKFTLHITLSM